MQDGDDLEQSACHAIGISCALAGVGERCLAKEHVAQACKVHQKAAQFVHSTRNFYCTRS
jgi:hypothetical protein